MGRYTSRWSRDAMQRPARPVPKLAGLRCVGVDDYHVKGLPAREQSTYWELARQFRGGDVFAFSWDAKRGAWDVWRTEADWLATPRKGSVKWWGDILAAMGWAALGHGPTEHVTAAPAAKPRAARAKRCNTPPLVETTAEGVTLAEVERRLRVLADEYIIPRRALRVLERDWQRF